MKFFKFVFFCYAAGLAIQVLVFLLVMFFVSLEAAVSLLMNPIATTILAIVAAPLVWVLMKPRSADREGVS